MQETLCMKLFFGLNQLFNFGRVVFEKGLQEAKHGKKNQTVFFPRVLTFE